MKPLPRLLLVVCTLLAVLTLLHEGITRLAGNSQGRLSSVASQLFEEAQRREVLRTYSHVIKEARAAKQAVTRKLINEQLPLEEALCAFAEIDRNDLAQIHALEGNEQLLTEQVAYEHVLGWVDAELHSRPRKEDEVVHRLREEWRALHTDPARAPFDS